MTKLPALTAKQVIKALKKLGFYEDRQKGSHLVLLNLVSNKRIVIPIHPGKTIKLPLLRAIILSAGVSTEEFIKLL